MHGTRLRLGNLWFTPIVAPVSLVKTTVRGRVYWRPQLRLPFDVARSLLDGDGRRGYAVALLARASHAHLQYWDDPGDPIWRALPDSLKLELEVLGLTRWSPSEIILIPARSEELKSLGFDPMDLMSLRSLVKTANARSPL